MPNHETRRLAVSVALAAALLAPAASAAERGGRKLATTHVTLYDCGLAQLERQATVRGAERLAISVELAHIDDLLASLVLATDGEVRVREVRYPTVQNLGQAVAASGMGNALSAGGTLQNPANVAGWVRALEGTEVLATDSRGRTRRGTVMGCVERSPGIELLEPTSETRVREPPSLAVVLAAEDGALTWIDLDAVRGLEPISRRESEAVGSLARQLGRATGFSTTEVVLRTAPGSRGRLAASYVRQAPLWRAVYKVSADDDEVRLEAWALVHNDTDENWNGVEMTLISGLPRSYVVSLASPRYQQREGLTLQNDGEMMPQLGAATPDSLLYEWELYGGTESLGMIGHGSGGGSGLGYGMSSAVSVGRGEAVAAEGSSSLVRVGRSAAGEDMAAAVEGEISTYRARDPVTIPAGSSALVPLLERTIEGRAFTLLEEGREPATCVRARNETGLVLQSGLASFYVEGRFRGQYELPRTEPGQIGVWCHGGDPDVRFGTRRRTRLSPETLEWQNGRLLVHARRHTELGFSIENLSGQARRIALRVRHISNGRVLSPKVIPAEKNGGWLHLLELEGAAERDVEVRIEEGVVEGIAIERKELLRYAAIESLPSVQRATLESAALFMARRKNLAEAKKRLEAELERGERRVARQRDNLGSIPAGASDSDLVEEMIADVMETESALRELREQIDNLDKRIERSRRDEQATLESLER